MLNKAQIINNCIKMRDVMGCKTKKRLIEQSPPNYSKQIESLFSDCYLWETDNTIILTTKGKQFIFNHEFR